MLCMITSLGSWASLVYTVGLISTDGQVVCSLVVVVVVVVVVVCEFLAH